MATAPAMTSAPSVSVRPARDGVVVQPHPEEPAFTPVPAEAPAPAGPPPA